MMYETWTQVQCHDDLVVDDDANNVQLLLSEATHRRSTSVHLLAAEWFWALNVKRLKHCNASHT